MDFSQYLDLSDPDGPRLVGYRIWLDQVLYEAVHNRCNAEQLIERFPTLNRETVYACLLYFEQNRAACLTRLYAEIARKEANFSIAGRVNEAKKTELLRRAGLITDGAAR